MPAGTALSTTKRKFHRILDSISNASSTSLATTSNHEKHNASTTTLPATMDPPAKKPRIARPTSAYISPLTAKQPIPIATMNDERKTPNFAPWDRGRFLERLKTYRHVDKWMGKPERINEVQWAKRGWSCVGKDRVGCVGGCGKELVITLENSREERLDTEETEDTGKRPLDEEEDEDEWREKAQEQLVEKYAEMIVTSHDSGCLWRRKGCDDTIQRLPLAHHKTAMDDLRQRYVSLIAISSELPPEPSIPEDFGLSSISQKLAPLLLPSSPESPSAPQPGHPNDTTTTPPPSITQNNNSALALALFGWQAEEDHVVGLATCTACFRRLGLWLFKPSSSSPDSPSQSSMHRLDVVAEHRDYCPWVNALSQNGTTSQRTSSLDGLAGWQTLLRAGRSRPQTAASTRDAATATEEVASVADSEVRGKEAETVEIRDERDKERWAKLKRLKQAFHVK
ncbi:C3HC zinc finger-like-domain-containing protein, partial [Usnea florida]